MTKSMFISVIIPMYNSAKTIKKCLEALYGNSCKKFECIVVDDCSKDNSIMIARQFPCKVLKLPRNSGPAKARNLGASKSKGSILFFLDSDVLLLPNGLKEIEKSFKKEPKIAGIVGIYDKYPANKGFFAEYMALMKFSYFMDIKKRYFSHVAGAITAIKKDIFFKFSGFPENYRGADIEDYVLGYKITSKYKLLFNPKIRGKHYMPSFKSCFKNYFKRSSMWFRIFLKRKKFDSGAASASRGIGSISAFFASLSLLLILFHLGFIWPFLIFIIIFLYINRNFYFRVIKEKNIWFLIASVLINFVLSLSVSLGVMYSLLSYPFRDM